MCFCASQSMNETTKSYLLVRNLTIIITRERERERHVFLSSSSIYGGFYLKVLIFQMPKGQFERSSCQKDWIWTDPSERAPPSPQSSSTGWRWSFRGVSMWSAGNAQSSPVSLISRKLRCVSSSTSCFH